MKYNIYCDESCHLEHDNSNVMTMGAMICPKQIRERICKDIREIKKKHNISRNFEIKWTKVSKSKIEFYLELINYFFMETNLKFRGLVILEKDKLNNARYNDGDYNLFYYKMYYCLLNFFFNPDDMYDVYIDIKDTNGGQKIKTLHNVLCNNIYDFKKEVINRIQLVNSNESEIMQFTDLFIGALSYYNRYKDIIPANDYGELNEGKIMVINRIQELSGLNLSTTTPLKNTDFNIFVWRPRR